MTRNHHIHKMMHKPDGSLIDPRLKNPDGSLVNPAEKVPYTAQEEADADAAEAQEIIDRPIRLAKEMVDDDARFRILMKLVMELTKSVLTSNVAFWADPADGSPITSKDAFRRLVEDQIRNP